MLNTKRSNRLNEMAKQQEYEVCHQCQQELQLKVKFCPFCRAEQSIQTSALPVMPEVMSTNAKQADSEIPTATGTEIPSEELESEASASVIVKHITKQGKELFGVIVVDSSLEIMRKYDRYAFKKEKGVFVRIENLAKIPNEYLSFEQSQLKVITSSSDINEEPDPEVDQIIPIASKSTPLSTSGQIQQTPLDTPKETISIDTPKETISFSKYIVLSFIVFLAIIGFVIENKDNQDNLNYIDESIYVDLCEEVKAEINSLLREKMPKRALTIIKLNQDECKTDTSFVQSVISAEAQINAANEKLSLAKDYLQSRKLDLSHKMLLSALEHDAELTGGTELLAQIEAAIEEFKLHQDQQTEEVSLKNEAVLEDIESIPQQNIQSNFDHVQRLALVERERAEAKRQTEQAQKERQKALEKERQKAESALKQNEERFIGQLSRAERALNANNYGLAKSLAREVLSVSPSNSQAKRILRQAEEGESAAFDDMVIQ